ncbi:hypothetical protein LCGC14_1569000 [marine sediment metagenome]|uniref:FCP1 homology domain-containing protein n=1 Tax=marine sediment metagenome TaxID=412755 RepID=A0A0F9LKV4_9ZZZZ
MKIIFLDIDGVLNTISNWGSRPIEKRFSSECVAALNRITEYTGAKIVISSSWKNIMGYQELSDLLHSVGIKGEIVGKTSLVKLSGGPRGEEIEKFICEYRKSEYDVSSFVILDDNTDMGSISSHLVWCDPETGLTKELADIVIRKLEE